MTNTTYGWMGKILQINLDDKSICTVQPALETYHKFIGGRGLAGWFLRPHATRAWDHPQMPLLVFTGPLTGTIAPTSGRCTVMCRSPLTGAVADASVGGRFGQQLKKAGWDGLIITGKAAAPCGIEIEDETVRFTDAKNVWGKQTHAVFDALSGNGRSVAAIGPAAENNVAFASLMVDTHHAAGRTGIGLCVAAKRIKYISVRGTGKISVYDRRGLADAREEILRLTAASSVLMGPHGFSCFGTGSIFDLMDSRRMMPTDNFKKTRFEKAKELNAFAYKEAYIPKKHGCSGCHIRCKKIIRSGEHAGISLPEFETMSHFSALVGNTDIQTVITANDLCNRYGMDTISAAATLACWREISGEPDMTALIPDMLRQIGEGTGALGKKLGKGSFFYATKMNAAHTSMSVKRLELPAYDPRGAYGMSLAYALSTRGGCHLRAYPISHEILRKPVATDRFSFDGKARIIKIAEDQNAVIDSLTACKFIFFAASLEEYAKAWSAATGIESTAQDLLKAGERIYYNERIINSLNGFDARHDDLRRFFTTPGTTGDGITIAPLNRADFLTARSKYYRIRGVSKTGCH